MLLTRLTKMDGRVNMAVAHERLAFEGFTVLRELGEGGEGYVLLARQESLGREVAIKVLPHLNDSDSLSHQLAQISEGRLLAMTYHDHVVTVYDRRVVDGFPVLIMEYVAGGNLVEKLTKPLSNKRVIQLAKELASALTYLHRAGLVHGDIKPSNILLDHHGRAKLCDFGVAQPVGLPLESGTSFYSPPEITSGGVATSTADQYSLALVLQQALTGEVPSPNRLEYPSHVSPETTVVFNQALSDSPSDRFASVEQFVATLVETLEDAEPPPKKIRRMVITGLSLTVVAVAGYLYGAAPGEPESLTETQARQLQHAAASTLASGVTIDGPAGMPMRLIPAGSIVAGTTPEEAQLLLDRHVVDSFGAVVGNPKMARWYSRWILSEHPPRRVGSTRPFYLGETEVTVIQWIEFFAATGYLTEVEVNGGGYGLERMPDGKLVWKIGPQYHWQDMGEQELSNHHPVGNISRKDAIAFCEWATKTTGIKHRLPSEDEWEYACRAGGVTRWPWGDSVVPLTSYANTSGNSSNMMPKTRQRASNVWGLHDMLGGQYEWTTTVVVDPTETFGILRGGCFRAAAWKCRPAFRQYRKLNAIRETIGFRVLREIP